MNWFFGIIGGALVYAGTENWWLAIYGAWLFMIVCEIYNKVDR